MQSNSTSTNSSSTTTAPGNSFALPPQPTPQPIPQTPRTRLESARKTIRHTQRAISINEGRLLDHETAENLWHMLQDALKTIESVTLNLAIMERKGANK